MLIIRGLNSLGVFYDVMLSPVLSGCRVFSPNVLLCMSGLSLVKFM